MYPSSVWKPVTSHWISSGLGLAICFLLLRLKSCHQGWIGNTPKATPNKK